MRSYSAPTLAAFQDRTGLVARLLVWVVARNRGTGLPEALGLWTGLEARAFTIGGAARTYQGAGGLMNVPPIQMAGGLAVRMHRLALSPISQEVIDLVRTYDARFAPVEVHRALFDPVTGALVDEPHRLLKGFVDEVEETTPEAGGEAGLEVVVASSARLLTRRLALKRSDETQRLRGGDRFRRYVDVSGEVDVYWGERRESSGGLSGLLDGGDRPTLSIGRLTR